MDSNEEEHQMNQKDETHLYTPQEHIKAVVKSKENYNTKRKSLPFEEKLKILVKLQEKYYFFGKTKVKPWPIGSDNRIIT